MMITSQSKSNINLSTFHRDGLLDMLLGLWFILAGVAVSSGLFFLSGALVPIFIPLWTGARKSITAPRLPNHQTSKESSGETGKVFLTLFVLGLLMLVTGILVFLLFRESHPVSAFLGQHFTLLFGLVLAAIWTVFGGLLRIYRWVGYAGILITLSYFADIAGWPFWIPLIAFGLLIFLFGLFILIFFIATHPKPTK